MTHHAPRTELATHSVFNQSAPLTGVNWHDDDIMLNQALSRAGAGIHAASLSALGAAAGSQTVQEQGRLANENPPKFKPFDRFGQRVDEVEFHPAYHELMALGLKSGVSAAAWKTDQAGHALHAGLLILMGHADSGVCCPMSMTYACVPALRHAGWAGDWIAGATSGVYDPRFLPMEHKTGLTIGMAMTEKQGGSDVRANTTRAQPIDGGDAALLTGHKWFCSAPMSDGFLTLAYEGGDAGGDGAALSCFLVPRWRPDGTRNAIEIQRLKDKLGDRSNASSEIEYKQAWARRVGEPGRGVRTIIEMVNHTRLDCLAGSAGLIRTVSAHAIWHADRRSAFQRRLIDQPLMREVLGELALEAEAALALAFRVAESFDRAASDPAQAAFARIATPIAKYWICKRAPYLVYEAMEAHGGAGYVEEHPLPLGRLGQCDRAGRAARPEPRRRRARGAGRRAGPAGRSAPGAGCAAESPARDDDRGIERGARAPLCRTVRHASHRRRAAARRAGPGAGGLSGQTHRRDYDHAGRWRGTHGYRMACQPGASAVLD